MITVSAPATEAELDETVERIKTGMERRSRPTFAISTRFAGSPIGSSILAHGQGMRHTRGKPDPMTQGKIERWHLSLKSRILLEN